MNYRKEIQIVLKLGEIQKLKIAREVSFGVYLTDGGEEEVLLPKKQVPEGAGVGDEVEVFLYRDSEDRKVATCTRPKLLLHEVGRLAVADVTKIGAFLEWGLERQLFLPFKEQTTRVAKGDEILAAVYLDKSERLCATMNVYPYLESRSPYHTGDQVKGTVYETSDNFGTFVAVDDIYSGLIPKKELVRQPEIGESVSARVTRVCEDGKLDLSLREKAYVQIEKDAEAIERQLDLCGGILAVGDKSDPSLIRSQLQMSKAQFKRAAGHLLKEGKITVDAEEIRRR